MLRRDRRRQRALLVDRDGDARVKSAHDALGAAARSERNHAGGVPQPRSRVAWLKRCSFVCPTPATATWGAFDATGRLVGALGRGTLQAAHAALAGRRCTALVNAVDVLAAEAALPAASQARLRQIAPFSLEESLANDVDEMVFAIGSRLPSGATQVAAVAKERMDAWLGELRAAGIVPHALCSEADGIPDIPATLVLVIEGERIAGRKPGRAPFVFEGLPLAQVLSLALAPQGRRARAAARQGLHRRRRAARVSPRSSRELGSQFASADVKLLNDGVFPHLAATLAQRPGTNLLQGAYAPKSNWLALAKPWRLAALARGRRRRARACCCKAPSTGSCAAPTRRSTTSSAPRVPARRRRLEHVGLSARDSPASRRERRQRRRRIS